jgi:hypothetical protein
MYQRATIVIHYYEEVQNKFTMTYLIEQLPSHSKNLVIQHQSIDLHAYRQDQGKIE